MRESVMAQLQAKPTAASSHRSHGDSPRGHADGQRGGIEGVKREAPAALDSFAHPTARHDAQRRERASGEAPAWVKVESTCESRGEPHGTRPLPPSKVAWVPGFKYGERRCRDAAACKKPWCGYAHPAGWIHHNEPIQQQNRQQAQSQQHHAPQSTTAQSQPPPLQQQQQQQQQAGAQQQAHGALLPWAGPEGGGDQCSISW